MVDAIDTNRVIIPALEIAATTLDDSPSREAPPRVHMGRHVTQNVFAIAPASRRR